MRLRGRGLWILMVGVALAFASGCDDAPPEGDGDADADGDSDGDSDGDGDGDGDGDADGDGDSDGDADSDGDGDGDADGDADGDGDADADGDGDETLSARYPGDERIGEDPAVLFHDDFESGWGRWDAPTNDTQYLHIETDGAVAHAGERYLRSTVTEAHLAEDRYISASTRITFDRVPVMYLRYYARFPVIAPNPHHWVRISAGAEGYWSSGLANTVPPGDEGFWFDFDITNDDTFKFYVYWYLMRSGRCNDGTAVPGCEGDQGTTYYYGNNFKPSDQTPFERDRWICIEIAAAANTVGSSDGSLTFWIDGAPVGDYRQGHPEGTWLRDNFYEGGCDWSACTEPEPFEGFDFRSSDDVLFQRVFLDAYYERDTTARKREILEDRGLTVSDEQTIYYDDVVIATQRIGCQR